MNTYWGNGGITPHILTSGLDGGEWLTSLPARFILGERASVPFV